MHIDKKYTAFIGERIVATGTLGELLPKLKPIFDRKRSTMFAIFDDDNGKQVDFDLRGSLADVLARYSPQPTPSGPGRPKLGVISREVTLLPRHWDWLELQPNGASGTIRRLIDEARKHEPAEMRRKQAIFAAGRFLTVMAGNYADYEESSRALYAGDHERFAKLTSTWPKDVRNYVLRISNGER